MTVWHARTERDALLAGLAATEAGRSRDARSLLGGTRLHVLDLGPTAVVHLTGSDGALRGALYHIDAERLLLPDLWCVLPPDAAARLAGLAPQPVDLGSRGDVLVVAGRRDSGVVEIPIARDTAYRGIPCLPSAQFIEVLPRRYWVIGGITPATSARLAAAGAQIGAVIADADIFEELDVERDALSSTPDPSTVLPPPPALPVSPPLPGRPRLAAPPARAVQPTDPLRARAVPTPRRLEGT